MKISVFTLILLIISMIRISAVHGKGKSGHAGKDRKEDYSQTSSTFRQNTELKLVEKKFKREISVDGHDHEDVECLNRRQRRHVDTAAGDKTNNKHSRHKRKKYKHERHVDVGSENVDDLNGFSDHQKKTDSRHETTGHSRNEADDEIGNDADGSDEGANEAGDDDGNQNDANEVELGTNVEDDTDDVENDNDDNVGEADTDVGSNTDNHSIGGNKKGLKLQQKSVIRITGDHVENTQKAKANKTVKTEQGNQKSEEDKGAEEQKSYSESESKESEQTSHTKDEPKDDEKDDDTNETVVMRKNDLDRNKTSISAEDMEKIKQLLEEAKHTEQSNQLKDGNKKKQIKQETDHALQEKSKEEMASSDVNLNDMRNLKLHYLEKLNRLNSRNSQRKAESPTPEEKYEFVDNGIRLQKDGLKDTIAQLLMHLKANNTSSSVLKNGTDDQNGSKMEKIFSRVNETLHNVTQSNKKKKRRSVDVEALVGAIGPWGSWSSCDADCGLDLQERHRQCLGGQSDSCDSQVDKRECFKKSCQNFVEGSTVTLHQPAKLHCQTNKESLLPSDEVYWIDPNGEQIFSRHSSSRRLVGLDLVIDDTMPHDVGVYHCVVKRWLGQEENVTTSDFQLRLLKCPEAKHCHNGGSCVEIRNTNKKSGQSRVIFACQCANGFMGSTCSITKVKVHDVGYTIFLVIGVSLTIVVLLLICIGPYRRSFRIIMKNKATSISPRKDVCPTTVVHSVVQMDRRVEVMPFISEEKPLISLSNEETLCKVPSAPELASGAPVETISLKTSGDVISSNLSEPNRSQDVASENMNSNAGLDQQSSTRMPVEQSSGSLENISIRPLTVTAVSESSTNIELLGVKTHDMQNEVAAAENIKDTKTSNPNPELGWLFNESSDQRINETDMNLSTNNESLDDTTLDSEMTEEYSYITTDSTTRSSSEVGYFTVASHLGEDSLNDSSFQLARINLSADFDFENTSSDARDSYLGSRENHENESDLHQKLQGCPNTDDSNFIYEASYMDNTFEHRDFAVNENPPGNVPETCTADESAQLSCYFYDEDEDDQ